MFVGSSPAQLLLLLFLLQGKVKHYVFVGSAGAYEANSVEPMHVEGDKRKPSAGRPTRQDLLECVCVCVLKGACGGRQAQALCVC